MTEENRAPPGHQYRAGCRMSADRALARHVGVAAFIVNNNPETMEGEPAIVSHTRRLPFTTPPPELARMVGGPHPSRRAHARRTWIFSNRALLVLARTAIVRPFREERPGPGGHLDRAAGRRIGCSRAARAAAEQDRDRFFIGPGWLKEPRVRITRKGSTKMSKDTTVCA